MLKIDYPYYNDITCIKYMLNSCKVSSGEQSAKRKRKKERKKTFKNCDNTEHKHTKDFM